MIASFPLLALSLLLYAILGWLLGTPEAAWHQGEALKIQLLSGDVWRVTAGDLFIGISVVSLFVELLRATKSGSASLLNHALSVVVFVVGLLLFITVKGYGNSIFFLFLALTFLDFMAGFIITSVTARRDFALGRSE